MTDDELPLAADMSPERRDLEHEMRDYIRYLRNNLEKALNRLEALEDELNENFATIPEQNLDHDIVTLHKYTDDVGDWNERLMEAHSELMDVVEEAREE